MERKELIKGMMVQNAVKTMMMLLARLSDKNLIRLLKLAENLVADENQKKRVQVVKEKFENGHPSLKAAKRISERLSYASRQKLARNLFAYAMFLGTRKRNEILEKEGWRPPFFLVISPTMRCNLRCIGCYAGSYSQSDQLTTDDLDRILIEAKDLGIYFVTISGGEPFIRKDLLELFEKHSEMYFQVYTNGTLIDEKVAEKLAKLGNVAPAISVEGFEKETDERRGEGIFQKLEKVWELLVKNGVMFGFSATPTRKNVQILFSDEFIDFIIEKGALFGWYFHYIPIGRKPDINLMMTPEQRNWARERLEVLRNTKPIVLADFWNDGHLAGGCIAGGRTYLHINANGDVEPCVFTHFAIDNIKNKSLREVINSPLMKAIQKRQPYSKNLMTPCMIIDEPEVLREIVKETGAYDTDGGGKNLLEDLAPFLNNYSKRIHQIYDKVWREKFKEGKALEIKYR